MKKFLSSFANCNLAEKNDVIWRLQNQARILLRVALAISAVCLALFVMVCLVVTFSYHMRAYLNPNDVYPTDDTEQFLLHFGYFCWMLLVSGSIAIWIRKTFCRDG